MIAAQRQTRALRNGAIVRRRADAPIRWTSGYLALDLVETHFWGMNLNADRAPALRWITTPYNLVDGDITYKTASLGSISLGCSNLTNTFQIVNENGTSNITYYAIQGRKYTVTYQVSF